MMYKWIWLMMALHLKMSAQGFEVYRAKDRGSFENKWLKARYSFSFNTYENSDRMGFGALLVLNDDVVAPGKGFGKHPHENMEIITIPLEGSVKHADSKGHEGTISFGEVQVMSAGTGIRHSEYNASQTDTLKSLQIWISTDTIGHQPRYAQKKYNPELYMDTLCTMVSPSDTSKLHIHQKAALSMGVFTKKQIVTYRKIQSNHGVYVFVIEGTVIYNPDLTLHVRDALGINDFNETITMQVDQGTKVLVIEVPYDK